CEWQRRIDACRVRERLFIAPGQVRNRHRVGFGVGPFDAPTYGANRRHRPAQPQNRRSFDFFFGGALNGASISVWNCSSSGCFGSFKRWRYVFNAARADTTCSPFAPTERANASLALATRSRRVAFSSSEITRFCAGGAL